jgi:hypothetical protein
MNRDILVTGFTDESQVRRAVAIIRAHDWEVVDIYAPYALHDIEGLLNRRRSRLPVTCFLGGAAGLVLALWLQFWTSTRSWPLNVGGRPWNSLPAFVPVAFECMVLLAGFSVVAALLLRSRLYPGRWAFLPAEGITDDCFAMIVSTPASAAEVQQALQEFHVECRETTGEDGNS